VDVSAHAAIVCPVSAPRRWHEEIVSTQLDLAVYELFANKAELLPLWLRLRAAIEALGPDVRIEIRERYAEFDRVGEEFVIAKAGRPAARPR